MPSTDYNSEDFQSELFPLHSPLLGKSWLVSSPPLSYMLKFSGYSCLIGDPNGDQLIYTLYNAIMFEFSTIMTHFQRRCLATRREVEMRVLT